MIMIVRVINLFSDVIVALICAGAVMSWFTSSFGRGLWKIYNLIQSVTEPLIRPFRNLLWRFSSQMGIDFSPVLAILAIQFAARVLTRILINIAYI
jgi:YggT family protein